MADRPDMQGFNPDFTVLAGTRGHGLPSSAHLLNAIRHDLATVVLPDVQGERARTLLAMMDLLLRHVAQRGEAPSPTGADAVRQEHAAWAAEAAREEAVETLGLDALVAARFVITPERLTEYLRGHVSGCGQARVTDLRQVVGGLSKETFLVTLDGVAGLPGIVLRRDIPNPPIATSAADEMAILRVIFDAGLPVPEPLHAERDPAHFGMPFLISRRVTGQAISGAVAIDNLDVGARENCRLLAAFLGRLHALPVESAPTLARPGYRTRDYVREHVESWRRWWLDNRMQPSAILDTAFDWLLANVPDAPRPVFVHGDAGLHNMMVEDGRTTAMIDWELAHVGDPSEDLQYCRNWVDQIMDFAEFMAIYRAHGGAEIDEATGRYYALLTNVRNVACSNAQYRGFRDARLPLLPSAYAGIKWSRHFEMKAAEELMAIMDGEAGR